MGKNASARFKNTKVFYRIFPMARMHWEHVKVLEDKKTVYVRSLQDLGKNVPEPNYWKFDSDGVFYNDTQEEIYQAVMADVLDRVFEGRNAIILAFGQTGSGKSLTTAGLKNAYTDRGIAPRIITELFAKKKAINDKYQTGVQMSYVEINNMTVTDLLEKNGKVLDQHDLRAIKLQNVRDEAQALKTLFLAEGGREFIEDYTTKHAANGILTFYVSTRRRKETAPVTQTTKIHVIDMAGIDICGNSTSLHKSPHEVGTANLAKTQLQQFLRILSQNNIMNIMASQRLNIFIQFLKDSLDCRGILRYIGHLRTDRESLLLTLSLLRFGQIVRGLKPCKLSITPQAPVEEEDIKYLKLKHELVEVQKQQDLDVMFASVDLASNITQERVQHMQHVAQEYLHGMTDEVVLLNVTDANTVVKVFKNLYNALEAAKELCEKTAYEKAYEDALTSVKKTESKMSSQASTQKVTRKPSKSKVENASIVAKSSRNSRTSLSKLPLKADGKSVSGQSKTTVNRQRSRTSTLNVIKKSASRRKNSVGSAESFIIEMVLPDNFPMYEEAWNMFTLDDTINYSEMAENVTQREYEAKLIHKNYLDEVNALHNLMDVAEIRKCEYEKAQMARLFKNDDEVDEEGKRSSGLEKACYENLQNAHDELLQQQEKVLTVQAEFRLALENCRLAKRFIKDQFDAFCQEKFQTSIPNLTASSVEIGKQATDITKIVEKEEPCRGVGIDKCSLVAQFEKFKEIMKEEMVRKICYRERNRKWIHSSRP